VNWPFIQDASGPVPALVGMTATGTPYSTSFRLRVARVVTRCPRNRGGVEARRTRAHQCAFLGQGPAPQRTLRGCACSRGPSVNSSACAGRSSWSWRSCLRFAQLIALGHPLNESQGNWLTSEYSDYVLALVAQRLGAKTLTTGEYRAEVRRMRAADGRGAHGGQLRLSADEQIAALAESRDRALAHPGLGARPARGRQRQPAQTIIEAVDQRALPAPHPGLSFHSEPRLRCCWPARICSIRGVLASA